MRPSNRTPDQLRAVSITPHFTRHAEGSVLIESGQPRVLCSQRRGTACRATKRLGRRLGDGRVRHVAAPTHTRSRREAASGKQSGRTQEIQRLIGRSLRAVVD